MVKFPCIPADQPIKSKQLGHVMSSTHSVFKMVLQFSWLKKHYESIKYKFHRLFLFTKSDKGFSCAVFDLKVYNKL